MVDYVGRTLGPYKLEAALGKGGMATVYRAYQSSVKRYVAIKVMAPEIADQPGFVERFAREAEVIASLEHPHILPVMDYGEADGIHYLVMRYIEGGSLEDRMRRKPLSMQECARMLSQMASALDYAHKRGVVHRDMKPNNVLLDSSENAYLTDFGIARLTQSDQKLTATGSVMGTPAYMSPEQALGHPVDARSDLYALGVMLYEMVLNRLPFVGDTPAAMIFQHVYEQPTPPRQIRPDLPDPVVDVLNKAMAKAPDDRFQSASDLSDAFVEAISARSATSRATPLGDMNDRTVIGGPEVPALSKTPTPPPPRFPTPDFGMTRDVLPTQGSAPAAPTPPSTVGGRELAPVPRRGPNMLLIGIAALVVIVILAGAGYAFISGNNAAIANQTGTAVMLAQSWTPTPTNTPPFTATPTATATSLPTETPNATLTQVAVQMATINAMQAAQATQTMSAMVQSTIQAALNATATGQAELAAATASAAAANATATARAIPTITPVPPTLTPTRRVPPTPTPLPPVHASPTPPDSAVQNQIAQLVQNGVLSGANGSVALTKDAFDLQAEKAGFNYWNVIGSTLNISDFVMSAAVSWNAPDTSNECGFVFRYTEPPDKSSTWTFYAVTITRNGGIRVIARDSTGYRDAALFEQSSNMVQADDGSTNQLLLIAQGKQFRLFVNGTEVGDFSDAAFTTGNIGVFASRNEGSTGLTCKYSNIWVYSLAGMTLADSLMSDTPGDVIAGLANAGLVPQGARLVVQEGSDSVATTATEQSVSHYNTISRTQFKNFVFSTDVTSVGDQNATTVGCGVFYNGLSVPDNLVAVYYTRDQSYAAYVRQNQAWVDTAIAQGTSSAILGGVSVTNRFVLVVVDGKITLFINGVKVFEATDTTFTNGLVGDYIQKGTQGGAEQCNYANTSVWRLN